MVLHSRDTAREPAVERDERVFGGPRSAYDAAGLSAVREVVPTRTRPAPASRPCQVIHCKRLDVLHGAQRVVAQDVGITVCRSHSLASQRGSSKVSSKIVGRARRRRKYRARKTGRPDESERPAN